MLDILICKKCRINEYGKDGWNEFAEAWADPNYPNKKCEPHIICPTSLMLRWADEYFQWNKIYNGFIEKMESMGMNDAADTARIVKFYERWESFIWSMLQFESKQLWQKVAPPLWCPYKEDHPL